jgi:hypothetical protein
VDVYFGRKKGHQQKKLNNKMYFAARLIAEYVKSRIIISLDWECSL